MLGRLKQTKTQVIPRLPRAQDMVEKADGDGRLDDQIIAAFLKLLLVQLRPVVQDSLFVIAMREHLHFDVELPAALVAGLDVQDRNVERLLRVERIHQLDVPKPLVGDGIENAVDDVDQDRPRRFSAEQMLERIIHLGIDFEQHTLTPRM